MKSQISMLTATVVSKTGLVALAQADCDGGGLGAFVLNITGQCGGQQKQIEFRSKRMSDDDRRSGVSILSKTNKNVYDPS